MTTPPVQSVVGGATITVATLSCGCVQWRQSLDGHDDAVSYQVCDAHDIDTNNN